MSQPPPIPPELDRSRSTLAMPYKDLLPPLASAEFEALKASIEREGVRDPILVDEAGAILDGHHRYRIAPETPRRTVPGLSEGQKRAFVLASNFHRRNLSPEQKAELRERQIEIARALKEEGDAQENIAIRLGISQKTVSQWLADGRNIPKYKVSVDNRVKVPKDDQAVIFDRTECGERLGQIAADFGISERHTRRICKAEAKRRERERELEEQAEAIASGAITLDKGPFDVIVIDPPWPYGTKYDPDGRRVANPYPEMSLQELAALDLAAADDCILWLWTTHKFMRHSFPLLDAWGFEEKVIVTWVKDRMGTGSWLRSQSEFIIMAVRGTPPIKLTNQTTVLHAPMREHSRKPDEFYDMVETLCLGPRRVDWFSREPRTGWAQRGNDTTRFVP